MARLRHVLRMLLHVTDVSNGLTESFFGAR
jgi:hypothetical protein